MNPAAILSVISSLAEQLLAATKRIEELEAQLAAKDA